MVMKTLLQTLVKHHLGTSHIPSRILLIVAFLSPQSAGSMWVGLSMGIELENDNNYDFFCRICVDTCVQHLSAWLLSQFHVPEDDKNREPNPHGYSGYRTKCKSQFYQEVNAYNQSLANYIFCMLNTITYIKKTK